MRVSRTSNPKEFLEANFKIKPNKQFIFLKKFGTYQAIQFGSCFDIKIQLEMILFGLNWKSSKRLSSKFLHFQKCKFLIVALQCLIFTFNLYLFNFKEKSFLKKQKFARSAFMQISKTKYNINQFGAINTQNYMHLLKIEISICITVRRHIQRMLPFLRNSSHLADCVSSPRLPSDH